MKIASWKEACLLADALHDWLGKHCPKCGMRHTKACIDGGRCVSCLTMLCDVGTLAMAVTESEYLTECLMGRAKGRAKGRVKS